MHGHGTHVHTREKYGGLDVAVCGVSVLLSSSITELRPVQAVETPGAIWSSSEVCSHLVKPSGEACWLAAGYFVNISNSDQRSASYLVFC